MDNKTNIINALIVSNDQRQEVIKELITEIYKKNCEINVLRMEATKLKRAMKKGIGYSDK